VVSARMNRSEKLPATGQATGLWHDLENFFSPVMCCGPVRMSENLANDKTGRRGVRSLGAPLTSSRKNAKTDKLLHYLESKTVGGQANAERDGIWFVEGYKNDGTYYAFPNWDLDVLVQHCAGLLGQTTIVLSQPCRMLAVSHCRNVKILCDSVSDEILVVDCQNVEVIIGHDAPKIGVGYCKDIKFMCSSVRNAPPLIETRQCEQISYQCAMARPGQESASEVLDHPFVHL